jgi:hypothetical protein
MSTDMEVAAGTNGGLPAPAAAPAPPAPAPVPALTGPLALMDPEARLNQLTRIARTLAPIFNQQGMFEEFRASGGGTRKYVNVEGWTLLGLLLDVYAHVDPAEPRPWMVDEDTWAVKIELRHISGLVVGGAVGVCGRTETDRYGKQPKRDQTDHQLQSMAHTRGVSKAFRVPFGVIAKLAGFASTPAEEMDGIGEDPERVRRAQDQAAEGRQRPAREERAREGKAVPEPRSQPPARLEFAPGRSPGWGDQADADSAHADLEALARRVPGGHGLALGFLREKGWLVRKGRELGRLTPARYEALRGKLAAADRRASAEPPAGPEDAPESVAEAAGLRAPQPAGPSRSWGRGSASGVSAGAVSWDTEGDPNDQPIPPPASAPEQEEARHPGVDDPAVRETMTTLGWADDDGALNTALGRHEQLEDSIAALDDRGKEIVTVAAGGDDLFGPDHLIALEGIAAGWAQLDGERAGSVQSFARNADPRDERLPSQIASMIAAHLTDQAKARQVKEEGETGGGKSDVPF